MEGFLTILGIYIVYAVIKNFFRNRKIESLVKEIAKEKIENAFKCKVVDDTLEMESGEYWDVLNVQMKGIVAGPHDNFYSRFVVELIDVTDGGKKTVLSMLESFQSSDSEAFWYKTELEELPYENTIFQEWSTVIKIPKIFLVCPHSGNRKLKVRVVAVNSSDKILEEDDQVISFNCVNTGYLEESENREYFEEMSIKTAMLVSASDGSMDTSEADIIKGWVRKRVASFVNEDYQIKVKERLNNYIKDAYTEINNKSIDIYEILEGVDNIASEGEKFELFQLCLDVAQADGEADEEELKIINDIAKYINLDRKQFRSMIEKTLPITMHTSEAKEEDILGITLEMTASEIKKHLMNEYKKWNQRIGSSDNDIREQAERMITLIAEARKKYR